MLGARVTTNKLEPPYCKNSPTLSSAFLGMVQVGTLKSRWSPKLSTALKEKFNCQPKSILSLGYSPATSIDTPSPPFRLHHHRDTIHHGRSYVYRQKFQSRITHIDPSLCLDNPSHKSHHGPQNWQQNILSFPGTIKPALGGPLQICTRQSYLQCKTHQQTRWVSCPPTRMCPLQEQWYCPNQTKAINDLIHQTNIGEILPLIVPS